MSFCRFRNGCWSRWNSHARADGTVILRRYFLPKPAEETAAAIRAFVVSDPDPEIEEPVIIRSADDLPDGVMPYMATLIAWHFSGGE